MESHYRGPASSPGRCRSRPTSRRARPSMTVVGHPWKTRRSADAGLYALNIPASRGAGWAPGYSLAPRAAGLRLDRPVVQHAPQLSGRLGGPLVSIGTKSASPTWWCTKSSSS